MVKLEKITIYFYILLLPFYSGLLVGKLHNLSSSLSFFPHLVGLVLMLILIMGKKVKYRPSSLLIISMAVIGLLNLTSIFMAIYLNNKLGVLLGRDTFVAVFPQFVYYLQLAFIIIYNDYIFSRINREEILRICLHSITLILAIGYIELLVKFNIGTSVAIFILNMINHVSGLDIYGSEPYIQAIGKINLMTLEASLAGSQISIYFLPLLLSLFKNKTIKPSISLTLIIATLPLLYFNKSTSGYFGTIICFMAYIYLLKHKKTVFHYISKIILPISLVFALLIFSENILNSSFFKMTFAKVFDLTNLSTLHRFTSVYTDYIAFLDYPIFGVGNGAQGFFYIKYFPNWGFNSYESTGFYYGESGWPGAGAFLPAFLSGYGLFGALLLFICLIFIVRNVKQLRGSGLNYIYDFLVLAGTVFIFQAYMNTDIIGVYYLIFIYSVAVKSYTVESENTQFHVNQGVEDEKC